MAWLYLFAAGLMEVAWAVGLKYTEGFTRLWPSVWTGAALALSMLLLAAAVRTLPLGTAALGVVLFGESASPARLACVGLIVAGLVGLKLTSAD